MEKLNLVTEWDKTFQKSEKVDHEKVTYENKYGFTLAADVYKPKNASEKLSAIIICGPYGAVKDQSAGLYAQTLAERGFLTIAFDPSYTGESSGTPRNTTSPEINTEDYSASVDYLVTREDVDEEKIGIVGICGWGGIALSAAAKDPRIKATVGSTAANHSDYNPAQRKQMLAMVAQVRTAEAKTGEIQTTYSTVGEINEETPAPQVEFYNYYRNPKRGYHKRGINSGQAIDIASNLGFFHFSLLTYIDQIENPVLMVHGENAFTYAQGKDMFDRLKGDNKKFLTVTGATHTDLYDQVDKIPFDAIAEFFQESLK